MCIGKPVRFTIDGKSEGKREYGTIHLLSDDTNLAEAVVEAGYAEVTLPPLKEKATDDNANPNDTEVKKERRLSEYV